MDVRLVQLLGSFIGARSRYALVRLEFAMRHGDLGAPPLIDRLPDASQTTLREIWPTITGQLEAAASYVKRLDRLVGTRLREDEPLRALRGAVRELEQYARAVDWVRTVAANEE